MKIGVSFFLNLLVMFFGFRVFAQDLLVKQNGDELQVTVESVSESNIYYYLFTDSLKVKQTILLSDAFMIKYANGEKRVFSPTATLNNTATVGNQPVVIQEYNIKGTWQLIVNGVALQNYIRIASDYEVLKVSFYVNPTPNAEYQIKQRFDGAKRIPNTYSADGFSKTTFTLLSESVLIYETYGEKREYHRCKGLDFAQPVQEDINRKNMSAYNRRGLFLNGSVGYKREYFKDTGSISKDFALELEFRLGKNVGLGFMWENAQGNVKTAAQPKHDARVNVFATRLGFHLPVRHVLDPYAGVTAMYHFLSLTDDQGKVSNIDAIKFGGFVGVRVIVFWVGGFVEYHYNTCAPLRLGACFTF